MTDLLEMMTQVAGTIQSAVTQGMMASAAVQVAGQLHLDDAYWDSLEEKTAFERASATVITRRGATAWAFATVIIMEDTATDLRMRPPHPDYPPAEGEDEVIWIVGVDLDDEGIQYGRVDITRVGDQVLFGELMVLQGPTRLLDAAPGGDILRTVLNS